MRPGGAPLWNLAQALVALIGPSADDHARFDSIRKVRQILNRGSTAFREIAETFGLGRNQNVCLLIDQFEGLFRFAREVGREEAETFAEVLSGFQTDLPTGVHVIITMRSDHLGDCGRYLGFAELVNRTQHLLPRMDELSLLRAIREPARLYGGDVSLELALRLIQDTVGEAVALPLAQHCLMRLWQQAKGVGQAGADPLLETRERPDTRRCDWEALRLAATGAGGRPHLAWASSSGGDEHGPVWMLDQARSF